MFSAICKKCGKVIDGLTQSQVDYNLAAHKLSKKCKKATEFKLKCPLCDKKMDVNEAEFEGAIEKVCVCEKCDKIIWEHDLS